MPALVHKSKSKDIEKLVVPYVGEIPYVGKKKNSKFAAIRGIVHKFQKKKVHEEEMREMCSWIAGLEDGDGNVIGAEIPLHISRFFPQFMMTDRDATDVRLIYRLAEIAREKLKYVYTGNC